MAKKIKISIIVLLILIVICASSIIFIDNKTEVKTIKSNKDLLKIYNNEITSGTKAAFLKAITLPYSVLFNNYYGKDYVENYEEEIVYDQTAPILTNSVDSTSGSKTTTSVKDYSTTNIQVENVDEADITKTDGDYIYSISEENVVITDVRDVKNIKIASKIGLKDGSIPEDLILYKDKLVIISSLSQYLHYNNVNTTISIYDISNKNNPTLLKQCKLYEPYYTSRCIQGQLYVISSGRLRKEDKSEDKIITYYEENDERKQIEYNNIKYLKDVKTNKQTLISSINLNNTQENTKISSYLIDISNAYVSEDSIYLLDEKYEQENTGNVLKALFGLKGVFGINDILEDRTSGKYTKIYKFSIKDGDVLYNTKTKVKGQTINQYSLDEQNGHLRIALYDDDGARIQILDNNLNKIGVSEDVAKGEKMYSSRFIGNKAYLVTYKNMDPLFVIDLSNEKNPEVLGELKIPGYSTYLHPYDENHIIGIGMETKEVINRNTSGIVTSTTSKIIGMKMALFDVSDVNNPKEISNTIIGNRRTTSAILTNPKALLFSKDKNLIAIPVNNYNEDFEVNSSDTYSSMLNSYKEYNEKNIAEGYLVYNINIEDGFKLKGSIIHENTNELKTYYYYTNSKLLRGLYIDNNLYTISENMIKVNDLNTLELLNELEIK